MKSDNADETASSENDIDAIVNPIEHENKPQDATIDAEFKSNKDEAVKISLKKQKAEDNKTPVSEAAGSISGETNANNVVNTINKASHMDNTPTNISSGDGNYEDWIVMPDSDWPPPIFIKKTAQPRERFYLEKRWHSQWSYYDSKASENKDTYFLYQRIVVIGALIIPALVSINSTLARFLADIFSGGGAEAEALWRIGMDSITVMVSLLVAGAAALESLYKYGDNWNEYRSAAEELQAEKNFYDMQAGPYASNPKPFATFVERVEGIVANQNGKYFQAVQGQLQKQSEDNDNIVASFRSGTDGDDEYELSVQSTAPQPADIG